MLEKIQPPVLIYLSPLMAAQSLEMTPISELSVRTFPAEEYTAVFTDPSKQKSVCRRDQCVFTGSSLFLPFRNTLPMFQMPQASTICVFTNSHMKAIYPIYSPAECIILFYTGNAQSCMLRRNAMLLTGQIIEAFRLQLDFACGKRPAQMFCQQCYDHKCRLNARCLIRQM